MGFNINSLENHFELSGGCSVQSLPVRFISRRYLFASSRVYKREVAPLQRNTPTHGAYTFQSIEQSPDLPHPVLRRAPRAGTVGLRNRASSSPVWEKGDKVFGEHCRATTDGFSITDFFTDANAEEVFPNDDYFPDINTLFYDDMGDNINAPSSTTTWATTSTPTPTVLCLRLHRM